MAKTCTQCGLETDSKASVCPVDGSLLTSADKLVGTTLAEKYQVEELLGRGGMSAVYKAKHLLMGRFVAIKLLRAELVEDPISMRRFQVESKAVSKLTHPNVMNVHDFGLTDEGIPYLIMDYLDGTNLSQILRRERQLEPHRAVRLISQACSALAHAHKEGVVHRDVKPSNLMIVLDESGAEVLKLVDFGIAKLLERESGTTVPQLTTTGEVFGSPIYMSPEQCNGQPAGTGSDIYSLGCVIYECLMGTPPIQGNTPYETLQKHTTDVPRSFAEVRPDINLPRPLEEAVFKALSIYPDDRFDSMAKLDSALRASLEGWQPDQKEDSQPDDRTTTVPVRAKASTADGGSQASGSFGSRDLSAQSAESAETKERSAPQAITSHDLFGNVVKPAAPDKLEAPDSANAAGRTIRDAEAARATGATHTQFEAVRDRDAAKPVEKAAESQGQSQTQSQTKSQAKSQAQAQPSSDKDGMPGSSSATVPQRKPITTIALVVAGVCGLGAAGYFGVKTLTDQHSQGLSKPQSPLPGSAPATTGTASSTTNSGAMGANDIFKTCTPSVVTLTITSKVLGVKIDGLSLTDPASDSPIFAARTPEGVLSLYQKGKPVEMAVGVLGLSKGKELAAVVLKGTQPIIVPVDNSGRPLAGKGGKLIAFARGVSLEPMEQEATGSGFFVRPDIVVTNCHVVSAGGAGIAGFAGGTAQITDSPAKFDIETKPIKIDQEHDLALLYVPGTGAKPLNMLTDYSQLKVGQQIYAIGSPRGLAGSLTDGLISADKLRGENPADPDSPKLYIQHSAKIDHGNSGGPLIDAQGNVIGVNSAGMGNGSINLAVVSKFINELLDDPDVQKRIEEVTKQNQRDLKG